MQPVFGCIPLRCPFIRAFSDLGAGTEAGPMTASLTLRHREANSPLSAPTVVEPRPCHSSVVNTIGENGNAARTVGNNRCVSDVHAERRVPTAASNILYQLKSRKRPCYYVLQPLVLERCKVAQEEAKHIEGFNHMTSAGQIAEGPTTARKHSVSEPDPIDPAHV
jgi:hypothetical protein